MNESRSLTAWHISTPYRPRKWGKMKIKGMKNNPCRVAAKKLARNGLRQVCNNMLLAMIKAFKG